MNQVNDNIMNFFKAVSKYKNEIIGDSCNYTNMNIAWIMRHITLKVCTAQNHRMICFGGALKIISIQPPAVGRDNFHYNRLFRAPSSLDIELQKCPSLKIHNLTLPLSACPQHHNKMSVPITTISDKVNSISVWIIEYFWLLFFFFSQWKTALTFVHFERKKKEIITCNECSVYTGMASQSLFVLRSLTKNVPTQHRCGNKNSVRFVNKEFK